MDDTIKNAGIESKKNVCENIGKIWKRNCPQCNKILTYKNYSNFWSSNKKNRICIDCHNKNQKKIEYPDTWVKLCKVCGKELRYKSQRSFRYAIKHKNKCKTCQDNIRRNRENRRCVICNNEFECVKKSKRKFCSLKCHYSSGFQKHERKIKYCKFCKTPIYYLDWEIKFHPKEFCSCKCRYGYQVSSGQKRKTKPEIKMENILKSIFPNILYNFELEGKFYDFYIPEKHLLIEVDGIYWHGRNVKVLNSTQKRVRTNDQFKNVLAAERGYRLIRFWEDEITKKNVSKYLRIKKR